MAEIVVSRSFHVCKCGKVNCEKNGCCEQDQKTVGCGNTTCKGNTGDPAACSYKNNCPVFLKFNNIKTLEAVNG